jgi:hypothetical protein
MKVLDKERFLKGMLEIYRSVDHLRCAGDFSDSSAYTTEDFIKAFKAYILSLGDLMSQEYIDQTEAWIRDWITGGPVFMVFNEPGLLEEVNNYIIERDGARDEVCLCGENEVCSKCMREDEGV